MRLPPLTSPLFPYTTLFRSIDPAELGRNYPNAVSILGVAKASLQQLIDAAPRREPAARRQWTERVQKIVAEWRAENRRSEEHTSELQSTCNLVCRLLLEK